MKAKPILRAASAFVAAAVIGVAALWGTPQASAQAAAPAPQVTPTDAPMPLDTSSPAPVDTSVPVPATTAPMPMPEATGGTAPAPGTDLLNNNPNGPDWLAKFARNPGPDRTLRARMMRGTMRPPVKMCSMKMKPGMMTPSVTKPCMMMHRVHTMRKPMMPATKPMMPPAASPTPMATMKP